MATSFAYDHPNYSRRSTQLGTCGVGTANVACHFRVPSAGVLHGIGYASVTAGTATTHTAVIRNGTTGIATTTIGTLAALGGTWVDCGDSALAAGDVLNILHGTDGTGVFTAMIEWTPTGRSELQN